MQQVTTSKEILKAMNDGEMLQGCNTVKQLCNSRTASSLKTQASSLQRSHIARSIAMKEEVDRSGNYKSEKAQKYSSNVIRP